MCRNIFFQTPSFLIETIISRKKSLLNLPHVPSSSSLNRINQTDLIIIQQKGRQRWKKVSCIMQDKIFALLPYILIFLTFLDEALWLIDGNKERLEQSRVVSSNWIHATSPRKLFKRTGSESFYSVFHGVASLSRKISTQREKIK